MEHVDLSKGYWNPKRLGFFRLDLHESRTKMLNSAFLSQEQKDISLQTFIKFNLPYTKQMVI